MKAIEYKPIGVIHSPFVDRTQASLLGPVPSAVAILAADEAVHLGDSE